MHDLALEPRSILTMEMKAETLTYRALEDGSGVKLAGAGSVKKRGWLLGHWSSYGEREV